MRDAVDRGDSVGIVAGVVAPCGREVYGYGRAEISGGRPVDEDTVFEIGSIGKVFTAVLLADAVTAPTYGGRSIHLVDLATHTSGLPPIPDNLTPVDENSPYADYTVDQMYDALSRSELTHAVGVRYGYSNFAMGLLGHILSLHSGMSYEALVVTRIADELGMSDTRAGLTPGMQERLATGYRDGEPFPLWDNPTLAGAGDLRSTVRDLLTFLAATLGLRQSSLYESMQTTYEAQVGVVMLTNTYNDIDEIARSLLIAAAETTPPGGVVSPSP